MTDLVTKRIEGSGHATMEMIVRLRRRQITAYGSDGEDLGHSIDDSDDDLSEPPQDPYADATCWPPSGEHQAVKVEEDPNSGSKGEVVDPFDTQIPKTEEDPALVDTLEPPKSDESPEPVEQGGGTGEGSLEGSSYGFGTF